MSFTFWGLGHSMMADTLEGSICNLFGNRMNPRYSTVSIWNLHFLGLAYNPTFWRCCRTSHTWFQWFSSESEYTRMSSRYPTVHTSISSPSTSLMNLWNDARALDNQNGITLHS